MKKILISIVLLFHTFSSPTYGMKSSVYGKRRASTMQNLERETRVVHKKSKENVRFFNVLQEHVFPEDFPIELGSMIFSFIVSVDAINFNHYCDLCQKINDFGFPSLSKEERSVVLRVAQKTPEQRGACIVSVLDKWYRPIISIEKKFLWAARTGHANVVKWLLASGDANALVQTVRDRDGNSIIHIALMREHKNVLDAIGDFGDTIDLSGSHDLYRGIDGDDQRAVSTLLESGADIRGLSNKSGITACRALARSRFAEVQDGYLGILSKIRRSPEDTPIEHALASYRDNVLSVLLAYNAEHSKISLLPLSLLLLKAAQTVKQIRILVCAGDNNVVNKIDLNALDCDGRGLLAWQLDSETRLRKGRWRGYSDTEVASMIGELTSLGVNDHPFITRFIVPGAPSVDVPDESGSAPITTALAKSSRDICFRGYVHVLIFLRADLSAVNKLGQSVLYFAFRFAPFELVQKVIKAIGPDNLENLINCVDKTGKTILDYIMRTKIMAARLEDASQRKKLTVECQRRIRLLRKYGALTGVEVQEQQVKQEEELLLASQPKKMSMLGGMLGGWFG